MRLVLFAAILIIDILASAVPWELYYTSRTRRIIQSDAVLEQSNDAEVIRRRRDAETELRKAEFVALAFTVVAPFGGAYLLYGMRSALSEPERYINAFSIRLFVLASGVKPWLHLFKLLKQRSVFLQDEIHYPSSEVRILRKRVARLEADVSGLRRAFATKADVRLLRDGMDEPLTQLSKAVRRHERKEQILRLSAEERFALVDLKLDETLRALVANTELMESLRSNHDRRGLLPSVLRLLGYTFGSDAASRQSLLPSNDRKLEWFQRGPLFYVFIPLSISKMALDYAGAAVGGITRNLDRPQNSGLLETHGSDDRQ